MAEDFRNKQEFQDFKNNMEGFNEDFKSSLRDALVLVKGIKEGFVDINNKSKWIELLEKLQGKGFDNFRKMGDHLFEAEGATKKLRAYYEDLKSVNEDGLVTLASQTDETRDILIKLKEIYKSKEEIEEMDAAAVDSYNLQNDLADELIDKLKDMANEAKKNLQFNSLLQGSFLDISTNLHTSLKMAKEMGQVLDFDPFQEMNASLNNASNLMKNLGENQFDIDGKQLNFQDAVDASQEMIKSTTKIKDDLMKIRADVINNALDIEFQFDKQSVMDTLTEIFPKKQQIEVELLASQMIDNKSELIDSIINSFAGITVLNPEQIAQADLFFKELDKNNKEQIKVLLLQEGELRRRNMLEEHRSTILENQLEIMREFKPIFNGIEESAQELAFAVDRAFNVLPNWMQQVLGTHKATKALSDGLQQSLNESVELLASGAKPTEAMGHFISSFASGISAALTPLGLFLIAAAAIAALLFAIEGTVTRISTEFGISRREAKKLYDQMLQIEQSYTNQFATEERILDIVKKHKETYGQLLDLSSDSNRSAIEFASSISSAYGVAAGEVYAIGQQFKTIGADDALSENLTAWLAQASEMSNIPFDIITKDLVEASEVIAVHFAGYPRQAAKAVIETRRLGMSLKQAGDIMDKSMDVSGFLTDMTELASMTGGMADLSKVFEMRFSGASPAEIAKTVVEEFDSLPKSMQENEFIAKKFAATIGTTVGELRKGQKIRQLSASLSKDELATLNQHLSSLTDADLLNAKSAAMKASELNSTERMGIAFNKIKATLMQALLPHIEALSDTLTSMVPLIDVIGILFKGIGAIIKFLLPLIQGFLWPFKMIGEVVGFILDGLNKWVSPLMKSKDATDSVQASMFSIGTIIKGIGVLMGVNFISKLLTGKKLLTLFPSLIDKIKPLGGKLFGGLGDKMAGGLGKMKTSLGKQGGLLGKIFGENVTEGVTKNAAEGMTKTEGVFSRLGSKLSKIFKSIASGIKELLTGIVDFITTTFTKIGSAIGSVFKSILGGIGEGLEKFGPKALQGAAALIIIAGALWITSKAVQNFASVEWDALAKAMVALGGLALTAVIIGNLSGQIILGALALAILGASLIPTAFALEMFSKVSWSDLAKAGVALLGLTVVIAALGAIMMSGVGAAAILLGAGALAIMGAAMIPAAFAMGLFASAFKTFESIDWAGMKDAVPVLLAITVAAVGITLASPGLILASVALVGLALAVGILGKMVSSIKNLKTDLTDPLLQLQNVNASKFAGIGVALGTLSAGLAALSIGNGLSSFVNMFTGDPLKKLEKLAALSSPMMVLSSAIKTLVSDFAELINQLKNLETIDISKIKSFSKAFGMDGSGSSVSVSKSIANTNLSQMTTDNSNYNQMLNTSRTSMSQMMPLPSTVQSNISPVSSIKEIKESVVGDSVNETNNTTTTKTDDTRVVRAIERLTQMMQSFANRPNVIMFGNTQLRDLNDRLKPYNNH